MLKDMQSYERPPFVTVDEAPEGDHFAGGLEYNPPARGVWNIVHTGMLIPGAHQIFVCAQGCLRGVILTAAEMGMLDRLSWVSVSEEDMFDGTLESDVVEGTAEIIQKLPERPSEVLLFLSCIHLFAGADFEEIIRELGVRFEDIHFTDCYMTPTMRKTVSPDAKMRTQLYEGLRACPIDPKSVNIIGCDRPTDESSELVRIIKENGFVLRDITQAKSYEDYQQMAKAAFSVTYLPTAKGAGDRLSERFGSRNIYIPNRFDPQGIREELSKLCEALGVELPKLDEEEKKAMEALEKARELIGDTAVAIDFTAVTRPYELAKLLCEKVFNVRYIVNDVLGEDVEAFRWLKKNRPGIKIFSALNVNMLNAADSAEKSGETVLAVGQKAAFFFATDNFVNIVANGGYYGFSGIKAIAELMCGAFTVPKDRRTVIQHKGIGCYSCVYQD